MHRSLRLAVYATLLALSTFAWADPTDPEGSYTSYDNLVNELKASAEDVKPLRAPHRDDFDWDEVAIHGGIALGTSWTSVGLPGTSGSGLLKGLEANLGMNLFSRRLRVEGAFGDFSDTLLQNGIHANLKEFELRFVYLPTLTEKDTLRFGTGFAARYMTLSANGKSYDSSAPMSLFLVGLEHKLTNSLSVGPDLSYRAPLTSDSLEKSAWDASFRLNATF